MEKVVDQTYDTPRESKDRMWSFFVGSAVTGYLCLFRVDYADLCLASEEVADIICKGGSLELRHGFASTELDQESTMR